MATASRIQVPASDSGLLGFKQTEASASKVSELLQQDLERHHVFFNSSGFHNHIAHHLLSLYGVGSGPDYLQKAFDDNASYQIKAQNPRSNVVEELKKDFANAPAYMGKGKHYADFLKFFQSEIEKTSWQEVLQEYLFKDDAKSRDLFARLYAGFLHPMIQLMYGIEWQQPAIVAEGLAEAAVHENRLGNFLEKTDAAAKAIPDAGLPTIDQLIANVKDNKKLVSSARWEDPNRIYDGIMVRAFDEAAQYCAQAKVKPEELEERTAEMIHTAAWVAVAAAFHPPHIPKLDFYLIHHLTSTPIFLAINNQTWIPTEMKVRLLEWKMRIDIIQFIARGCPPLNTDAIRNYTPKDKTLVSNPEELLPRFYAVPDDGHTIKVVRALLLAQEVSKKYTDRPWIRVVDDDMWLKMHYVLLDSVEKHDDRWVFSAGFDQAWKSFPIAK